MKSDAINNDHTANSGDGCLEGGPLVISETYLPLRGGHIVWLHELCRRLRGSRVLTVKDGENALNDVIEGVTIKRIATKRHWYLKPESLMIYIDFFRNVQSMVPRERMPVIIAGRVLPDGFIATRTAKRHEGISVVFAHGEEVNRWSLAAPFPKGNRLLVWVKRMITWSVYRRADLIIANSCFTYGLLIDNGIKEENIVVAYPGTDPERFKPTVRDDALIARYGLNGRQVLLSVGRLTPRKGQDMTLRALPNVLKHFPDLVYVIAGTGEYECKLRELARELGVDSSVRFVGNVASENLAGLYNLADIFIMANRTLKDSRDIEGFGIVYLEAGACGIPVIAGNTGGTTEAVCDNETGLIVDGDNPEQIAQAINRILGDTALRRRLGEQGRKRVCAKFTWEKSVDRIRTAIQKVARNARTD